MHLGLTIFNHPAGLRPVAPASTAHDQFFPSLSVSPTGLVGVSCIRPHANKLDRQERRAS
jgi:hypothetical protein